MNIMINRRSFLKGIVAAPAAILLPSLVLAKPEAVLTPDIHQAAKTKLMYLEVSARRSGKTMRLFEHMTAYIRKTGNDVYFITMNTALWHDFVNHNIPKSMKSRVKQLPLAPEEREDLRYYFDEADLVDKPFQVVSADAYYVGTPHGTTYWLHQLAKYNDMQYKKYLPYYNRYKTGREDWTSKKDWPSTTMYNQEVLGKFN